jgi:hypothetical protein
MLDDRMETIRRFPHRFARPGQACLEDSLILILGGFMDAAAVCACTLRYAGRRCRKWQACPFCAYHRERDALDRYRPAAGLWRRGCSVTVKPSVPLEVQFQFDLPTLLDAWDRLHAVAHGLLRSGALAGMWWGEHFLPRFHADGQPGSYCWPHLHGFGVLADGMTAADVAYEADDISVFCRPLADEAHAKNLLDYVITIPPFGAAYKEGWTAVSAVAGSREALYYNQTVRDVVGVFEESTFGRRRTRSAGVMHHRHRHYVGATGREMRRSAHRAATRAWLGDFTTRSEVDASYE